MADRIVIEPVTYPLVSSEVLSAYADASGDHNPIHLDETVARQFGLPGRIAHGMLIAGWVSDRAAQFSRAQFGGADYIFRDLQFRFKGMTLLGDQISVAGNAQPQEDGYALELTATNQRGEITVQAHLTVLRAL